MVPVSRTPTRCRSPICTCMAAASTWSRPCCTKVIPLELFETRRLLGAIVGMIGLAVTWRLGRRVGGPLAGLAALLLLALCPTFYGHMFINPKDAPFAVAMVILILGLVRLRRGIPLALAADHPDRGSWRRAVDRLAHPGRPWPDLCPGRLRAAVEWGRSTARGRAKPPGASCTSPTACCPA